MTSRKNRNSARGASEESRDSLHCLECGATLASDASSCPDCGNEKLILPTRWTPSDAGLSVLSVFLKLSRETRLLLGMSLILFCSLWLLGAARARNQVRLDTPVTSDARMEIGGLSGPQPSENSSETEDASTLPVTAGINELRLVAIQARNHGAWYETADAWVEVTNHPDSEFSDFIALADAYKQLGDYQSEKTTLNRICVRFPDRPEGYLRLGLLNEDQGNMNAARFQYEVGLSYCPGSIELSQRLTHVDRLLNPEDYPQLTMEPDSPIVEQWLQPAIGPSDLDQPDIPGDSIVQPAADLLSGTGENVAETHGGAPVTLFGVDNAASTGDSDSSDRDETDGTGSTPVQVSDLRVSATDDNVRFELFTDRPAAFGTSLGSEPTRLFVRLPDAQIALGARLARSMSLNVPLAERVNLIEGTDENVYISMVIYLGEGARFSVSSTANAVIVNITRASE